MVSPVEVVDCESDHNHAYRHVDCHDRFASVQLDDGKATTENTSSWEATSTCDGSSTTEEKHGHSGLMLQALMTRVQELRTRYNQTEDVEERIRVIRDTLTSMLGDTAPDLGILRTAKHVLDPDPGTVVTGWLELTSALGDRYQHIGQLEDLNEQVDILERALGFLPDNPVKTALIKRELGAVLRTRFQHTRSEPDIQEAVRLHSSLLEQHYASQRDCHWLLYELGHTLYFRFEALGDDDDRTRCITLQSEAMNLFPESDPWRFLAQISLGNALRWSCQRNGDVSCLHTSISLFRDILHTQSPNHRDRYLACRGFSACMGVLYQQAGNLNHLEECVAYGRQALSLQDTRSPTRWNSLRILASALQDRHEHLGAIADIQESIALLRQGLGLRGERADIVLVLALAAALVRGYYVLGEPGDLDESIRLSREASNSNPPKHLHPYILGNLGDCLQLRYRRDRNAEDIAEAIGLYRNSLTHFSGNKNTQGRLVYTLVHALSSDDQNEESLEEARAFCETWLAPNQGIEEPRLRQLFLSISSKTLSLFYERHHRAEDLAMAILRHEEALAYYPEGHAWRHIDVIDLAVCARAPLG